VTADAGEIAARERVGAVLDRLERVQLGVIVVAPPDRTTLDARHRARDAAFAAGRSGLLDEATEAARALALRSFARSGFSGTWAATEMSASVASAKDRLAAAAAFEGTVTAAVVEDLVDAETLEVLNATSDELASLSAVPSPGSLSSLTAMTAASTGGSSRLLLSGGMVVALVVGYLVTGSLAGAVAGGFVVAGVAWLSGRRAPAGE
jgi:hypothetical protein